MEVKNLNSNSTLLRPDSINRVSNSSAFSSPRKLKSVTALSRGSRSNCLSIKCGVKFRPCIDIHKGKVKQIVGSTLSDIKGNDSTLVTNFESDKSAAEYASLYKEDGLKGGHYVFNNGQMDHERLKELVHLVGKQRLVLDLSCRKKDGKYAIVTDRWQKFSDVYLDEKVLNFLSEYADEFLVHGVDVEGKKLGIDEELVELLGKHSPIPVTYAGGVTVIDDMELIKVAGSGRVDVTVGSALDIFGGKLAYKDVVAWHCHQQALPV
ncbi:hypothetical protein R6Q59_023556 [Mikania micrantha]